MRALTSRGGGADYHDRIRVSSAGEIGASVIEQHPAPFVEGARVTDLELI